MTMYTADGQAVEMIKKLEEGYLGKLIYEDFCADNEDGDFESKGYIAEDKIYFFDVLFENPLTEAYAGKVKSLKREAEKLQDEIGELKALKHSEQGLLHKVAQYPFVQSLVDYLAGDYEFILFTRDYEVKSRQNHWSSAKICVANFKDVGWHMRMLYNDNYLSENDKDFRIFKTIEDLNQFAKTTILAHIKAFTSNYNPVGNFESWYEKISGTCKMKVDPEVLAAYKAKLGELTQLENGRKAEQLQKEVQELEKKKKELEKLSAPIS